MQLRLMLLFLLSASAFAQKSQDCWDSAMTTVAMTACAGNEYSAVDAEMNAVYRKLLDKYKPLPAAQAKFRAAQRAWLKYRDAQTDSEQACLFGNSNSLCRYMSLTRLTQERLKWLQSMLTPPEDDICAIAGPDDWPENSPAQPQSGKGKSHHAR